MCLIFVAPTMSCTSRNCLCAFPEITAKPGDKKKAVKYLLSLPEDTATLLKLYDTLLRKTYQEKYNGMAYMYRDGHHSVQAYFITADDGSIRSSITVDDEMAKKNWKIFKRSLDMIVQDTFECGICYITYQPGKHEGGYVSCKTCGNCWCGVCDTKNEETGNGSCPYCRA